MLLADSSMIIVFTGLRLSKLVEHFREHGQCLWCERWPDRLCHEQAARFHSPAATDRQQAAQSAAIPGPQTRLAGETV